MRVVVVVTALGAALLLCRIARLQRELAAIRARLSSSKQVPTRRLGAQPSRRQCSTVASQRQIATTVHRDLHRDLHRDHVARCAVEPSGAGFDSLPEEGLSSVLAALPPMSQLVCERVCHEWRHVVGTLATWPQWCALPATLTETGAYGHGCEPRSVQTCNSPLGKHVFVCV